MIDLTSLLNDSTSRIDIDEEYEVKDWKNKDIKDLSLIKTKGFLERKEDDIFLNVDCSGKMLIEDSISLDEVWYPFSFNIDENIKEFPQKEENYLDIIEILCQNIEVEVPLRYTLVTDYQEYIGDGWKLVSEEELEDSNNPFKALQNTMDRSDE